MAEQVARAWFFAACVALVLIWAPSLPLLGSVDTWQLVINTITTIITFLLLALLHNTTRRSEKGTSRQLDRIERKVDRLLAGEQP